MLRVPKHLLVPVDVKPDVDREFAVRLVRQASDLAHELGARRLDDLAAWPAARGTTTATLVRTGARNIPRTIIETAAEVGDDMMSRTTHGRRGVSRLILGSVPERTAHLSELPLLLIPPNPAEKGLHHADAHA